MAIHILCKCKTSNALDAKSCSSCGAVFGRDKRYRICVSLKGKRVTKVCDNLTLAREAESALKADMVRGQLDIQKAKPAPLLDEVWGKYLPWAKEHKKTWKDDFYHYGRHIQPRFGKKPLDKISPIDVERMKMELKQGKNQHGKPFAPATIKHMIIFLNRLYNVAIMWGLYKGDNPIRAVQKPKLDNQRTEFLTSEEVKRLLKTLDEWPIKESADFVKFALFTGFRRGELFRLRWEDIDFSKAMVTLRDPKGGKTETVPISPKALDVLKSIEERNGYVFPGKHGQQRTDFKFPWMRIRKAAGLPENFRFHGLRHNLASHLVSNGVDLYTVGKLLCHRNTSTTARYAHLADEALRKAATMSGELLSAEEEKEGAELIHILK